jgi:hypothetical protein
VSRGATPTTLQAEPFGALLGLVSGSSPITARSGFLIRDAVIHSALIATDVALNKKRREARTK